MSDWDKEFTARLSQSLAPFGAEVAQAVLRMAWSPANLSAACRQIGLAISDDPKVQIGILASHVKSVGTVEFLRQWTRMMEKSLGANQAGGGTGHRPYSHSKLSPVQMEAFGYRPTIVRAKSDEGERLRWILPRYADVRDSPRTPPPEEPPVEAIVPDRPAVAVAMTWPQLERRSGRERRSGKDRRHDVELIFKNKRFGKDRRSGKDRRRNWKPWQ